MPSVGTRVERRAAQWVLVFGACVIGVVPVLVRLADVGPAAVGFWRLTLSLPVLAVLAWRTSGGIGRPSRYSALAGCAFALDLGFWHYGIANTSVGKATLLANLTPIVVTAASWWSGMQPAPGFLLAVVLSVGGAWVMAAARGLGSVGPNPLLGDMLSFATAFWYAGYFLAVGRARRHESAPLVMFWTSTAGAPLLLAASLLLGERVLPNAMTGWLVLAGLAAAHVAGQGSIAWALGRLAPAHASVTVLVQPAVAVMLGWLIFHEMLGAWQFAGAALVVWGVILAQGTARTTIAYPSGRPAG